MNTILWHDYETWGANPQKDHPAQFAGIRTDENLNVIGKPIMHYCQIPNDYLPHPQACLITGITPQLSLRDGLCESDFMAKIAAEFSQPNTCVAGYNSLRFDDEVTRYGFYRNFIDPYAREWQNGNSRWDVIDLIRACYALRPEGIKWPMREDGSPSFKLEQLTVANGIAHEDAHDAMSDVYATIAMAKLVKAKQPKLYDYLYQLRSKKQARALIDCFNRVPLVHISSKLPANQGCCTWIVPICEHPSNANAIIALDLTKDPTPLFNLTPEILAEKLYQPTHMLAEGEQRLPIKLVHMNKCPVLAPAKVLTQENAERLGIDRQQCLKNLEQIKQFRGLESILHQMYEAIDENRDINSVDPDYSLYSGGFFSQSDKHAIERIRQASPEQLISDWQFDDQRLHTLLFRYRARNFSHTLNASEVQQWQAHRQAKLQDNTGNPSISLEEFMMQITALAEQYANDTNKIAILRALSQHASNL